jgi:hypothetical protein
MPNRRRHFVFTIFFVSLCTAALMHPWIQDSSGESKPLRLPLFVLDRHSLIVQVAAFSPKMTTQFGLISLGWFQSFCLLYSSCFLVTPPLSFQLCSGLAIVSDEYFVVALQAICDRLKLSPDVAGKFRIEFPDQSRSHVHGGCVFCP